MAQDLPEGEALERAVNPLLGCASTRRHRSQAQGWSVSALAVLSQDEDQGRSRSVSASVELMPRHVDPRRTLRHRLAMMAITLDGADTPPRARLVWSLVEHGGQPVDPDAAAYATGVDRIDPETARDGDWAVAVADAEEAISREHTMWLASRSDVNERIGK